MGDTKYLVKTSIADEDTTEFTPCATLENGNVKEILTESMLLQAKERSGTSMAPYGA
jgi:hypothetical protein